MRGRAHAFSQVEARSPKVVNVHGRHVAMSSNQFSIAYNSVDQKAAEFGLCAYMSAGTWVAIGYSANLKLESAVFHFCSQPEQAHMVWCTVNGEKHEILDKLAETTLLEWLRGTSMELSDVCKQFCLPSHIARIPGDRRVTN